MNDRLYDLLVQRATDEISPQEARELASELEAAGIEAESIELAVAAAWQAYADGSLRRIEVPEALTGKLLDDANAFFEQRAHPRSMTPPQPARRPAASLPWFLPLGWAVAAALAVALVWSPSTTDVTIDPANAREALLADAADAVVYPWQQPAADGYEGATGDVTWSDELQRGYLRLTGLPANDPAVSQYQLWIVDSERDTNPVDGGVFDIGSASGTTVVPIDAKLAVSAPEAFAITREQPGGVVVSDGPLLIVARGPAPAT